MHKNYQNNYEKYVHPLVIKGKNKERMIITYNNDTEGFHFKVYHKNILRKLNRFPSSKYSFAYKKGCCTKDAVKNHMKSKVFIKLDIKSFFETIIFEDFLKQINRNKIYRVLMMLKDDDIRDCFYYDKLSLGYVTSPKLSDMYLYNFDKEVEKYISSRKHLCYSRYCDDMLISSKNNSMEELRKFYFFIEDKLKELGLTVNKSKYKEYEIRRVTSVPFLGLNISKGEKNNKVTISKSFILKTLDSCEKLYKKQEENDKCIDEIKTLLNSRKIVDLNDEEKDDLNNKMMNANSIYYDLKFKYTIVNSRVSYIRHNSDISFEKFLKKHRNKFHKNWVNHY